MLTPKIYRYHFIKRLISIKIKDLAEFLSQLIIYLFIFNFFEAAKVDVMTILRLKLTVFYTAGNLLQETLEPVPAVHHGSRPGDDSSSVTIFKLQHVHLLLFRHSKTLRLNW